MRHGHKRHAKYMGLGIHEYWGVGRELINYETRWSKAILVTIRRIRIIYIHRCNNQSTDQATTITLSRLFSLCTIWLHQMPVPTHLVTSSCPLKLKHHFHAEDRSNLILSSHLASTLAPTSKQMHYHRHLGQLHILLWDKRKLVQYFSMSSCCIINMEGCHQRAASTQIK